MGTGNSFFTLVFDVLSPSNELLDHILKFVFGDFFLVKTCRENTIQIRSQHLGVVFTEFVPGERFDGGMKKVFVVAMGKK